MMREALIYFDSENGEKNSRAMCYKENQMKVKRQSQLKQNSCIALVKYLIHTVLIIMLSFLSQNCSRVIFYTNTAI